MNKCQHGEKISIFCASQCCAWKESGGCQLCMRKYHNHMGTTIFVSEDQVQVQVKKYQLEHSIKPKCRLLQEAIYNYFNLIKNEINNSIDLVCKNIINQIGYPFLYANNALSYYKRLKNKQYKKINQKQFRSFYELSVKLNDKDLAKDQAFIYLNQTKQTQELLNSLQTLMHNYENICKKVNFTLNHDSTFMNKISDIIKSLNCQSPIKTPPSLKSKDSETKPFSAFVKEPSIELRNEFKIDSKLQSKVIAKADIIKPVQKPKETNPMSKHSRDVSLDQKIIKQRKFLTGKQGHLDNNGKIQNLKQELNQKELEINQKKKQLLDMMKQKQDSPRRISIDKQKKNYTANKANTPLLLQLHPTPRVKEIEPESILNDQKSSDEGSSHLQGRIVEATSKNYAFTKLPLQENKVQQKQVVKKKLIFIPTLDIKDIATRNAQTDSPLYKKKEIINKFDQLKLQKQDKIVDPLTPLNSKTTSIKKQEVLQLKDNEEKSLALLLKSLTLKAQEAITYLESALKLADNNLSAAEYLTYLYLELNRPRDCLILCNRILDRLETSSEGEQLFLVILSNKAAALNVLGRYSQAIVIVQRCLKCKQKDILFKILGDSYLSIGVFDKAIYNYQRAIKLNQMIDETHYNLAVCMYSQENYNNAKLSIHKALELQPKNQIYQELLTNIELKIGQC